MSPIQRSCLSIRYSVALFVVVSLPASVELRASQTPPWMPPAREIDAVFAEFDGPGSVGCALGVARHGELVYTKGYGYANLDWGIPITPTTAFYVGSVAKQFTAAAIALLALQGKLSLVSTAT